jgi:bifunctional NMN adenylyltransferase/nudix hydrolase
LIGFYKDASSYYINYFPQWKLDIIPEHNKGLSATEIRHCIFGVGSNWGMYVTPEIDDYICNWIEKNKEKYKKLSDEFDYLKKYKKTWENTPFPPVFVTTDALVISHGHVLLVKRGRNPGKDLWAMPGGFLNQNETLEQCCLRELKEETQIDVALPVLKNSIKKVEVFDDPIRDPRGRTITHAFVIKPGLKELPSVKGSDDANEAKWISYDKLSSIKNQFFNDHYQIIQHLIVGGFCDN